MATLSSDRLLHLLLVALPGSTRLPSPHAPKPVLLQVPNIGRVRIYLWTTTPDESEQGRPEGEHKSQIIIPGTPRGSRQHLDINGTPTFVMGYSPLFGVFIIWEAARHQDGAYSKNIQVKADLLQEATEDGWAIDTPRRTRLGLEVRAAIHPSHLHRFLKLSIEADARDLAGSQRQAFLLANAPDLDSLDIAAKIDAGEHVELRDVERARIEATGTRLKRAMGFSKRVLDQFGHRCAICQIQLSILEGAHIIPVHDSKGSDEVWNGLALCRNHHSLFDRRIVLIDSTAFVRADEETLAVLRDAGRLGGYQETIGNYRDNILRCLPKFFQDDRDLTRRMAQALKFTFDQN
jgi:putative restriction endonuclease